jgi:hypothetical protein
MTEKKLDEKASEWARNNTMSKITHENHYLQIKETYKIAFKQALNLNSVGKSYSLQEVREIALTFKNESLYALSHNLTRNELKNNLDKIYTKHDLHYKEGIDYVLE